jgi:hypothetical protein
MKLGAGTAKPVPTLRYPKDEGPATWQVTLHVYCRTGYNDFLIVRSETQ